MSNASGGVILLGVSTTIVKAHNLDIASSLEPIGNVRRLADRVGIELSQLTVPPVVGAEIRAIVKGRSEAGVVAILIPPALGDPVRSAMDDHFYFRGSDGDTKAPFEVIRRLFSASDVPDLRARVGTATSRREPDGSFRLPIVLDNTSSAVARDIAVSIRIDNPEACLNISVPEFADVSHLNPGSTTFMSRGVSVVHRGLGLVVCNMVVTMAGDKWPHRILVITVTIYADKMRARSYRIRANLKKAGLELKSIAGPEYLY
jgi:hypothetical protein